MSGLSDAERLDFLRELDQQASQLMKIVLEDTNCFTPNSSSRTFGHFWGIPETRPYIRLLKAISAIAETLEDFQVAYDYNLRILTYNSDDNMGTRSNFNLLQIKLGRDLQAYNYAMHQLDQHFDRDGVMKQMEGKDYPTITFDKYSKEDIHPQSTIVHPNKRNLKHADPAVLFTGALALFKLLGPCPKASAWLAAGHGANRHVLPILMQPDKPSYPAKRFFCPRARNTYVEAADLVVFTKRQFCSPEAQEWLRIASVGLPRMLCDFPGCGKVESYMGEWRRCTGCYEVYYCSEDCQKRHWSLPGREGHKSPCKNTRNIMNIMV